MKVFKKITPAYFVLLTVSVLLATGFYVFPWISDDINFRILFREYFAGEKPMTLSWVWEHICWRYFNDNGRFANVAMVLGITGPDWGLKTGSLIAAFMSMSYGLKLSGLERSFNAAALFTFGFIVAMPWQDSLYVTDFQLNYLWSGAIMLAFLYMFLFRRGNAMVLCAMGLLLGLWQESCGFPALIAVLVVGLLFKSYRDRRTSVAVLALVAGLCWLYFSPGAMRYRTSAPASFSFRINILAVYAVPPLLFGIWTVSNLLKRRFSGMSERRKAVLAALMVVSVVSTALMFYSCMGPRVGWAGVLSSLIGMICLLHQSRLLELFTRKSRRMLAWVLLGFTVVHLGVVDVYSLKEGRTYRKIIEGYISEPDKVQFADLLLREELPLYCLQKPHLGAFSHWANINIQSYFYRADGTRIRVVPERLRDFNRGEARVIDGSGEFYEWKGLVVGPVLYDTPSVARNIEADYGRGLHQVDFFTTTFPDAAGVMRAWYYPDASTLETLLCPTPLEIVLKFR